MQTPKEIFLEMLRGGQPERQLKQYEAFSFYLADPVNGFLRAGRKPGATIVDKWGVTISWPEDHAGAMPLTEGDLKVIKDIKHWRDYVHVPEISTVTEGWEAAKAEAHAAAGEDKLVTCFMGTGIFEQCHFLMGFEDALTAFYENTKEMHELIECITDYRIEYALKLIDGIEPDVLFTHDDWGAKESMFLPADMWREFFKEPYRRFYGAIRERGVIGIHHADSYLVPIVEDMVEIGIRCWQGILPENDIPAVQKQLGGRMLLMGGIAAGIDRADAEEDEIRSYVSGVLRECCPGGGFIPSITYGLAGTVFKHVDPVIDDEIEKYNSILHMPFKAANASPRRIKSDGGGAGLAGSDDSADGIPASGGAAYEADGSADNAADTLPLITEAVRKGKKSLTVELCRRAVEEGVPAEEVLYKGLIRGMNELGQAFSAGDAFVPEMLIAAKAMDMATEYLRPLLVDGDSTEAIGKVCLGTIKGDRHDIGKNLVKIMMEGCGLDVIDLGVDVPPERFIEATLENGCDIIACSALLTPCLPNIRRLAELMREADLKDRVKLMIGGAPVSQGFCDEIGADIDTDDAGSAAREAIKALVS